MVPRSNLKALEKVGVPDWSTVRHDGHRDGHHGRHRDRHCDGRRGHRGGLLCLHHDNPRESCYWVLADILVTWKK